MINLWCACNWSTLIMAVGRIAYSLTKFIISLCRQSHVGWGDCSDIHSIYPVTCRRCLPNSKRPFQFHSSIPYFCDSQINEGMQLIQNLINKSSRICTRSPSGFVLEVSSDSSGHRVVVASPVDQNLSQYFVVTELPYKYRSDRDFKVSWNLHPRLQYIYSS